MSKPTRKTQPPVPCGRAAVCGWSDAGECCSSAENASSWPCWPSRQSSLPCSTFPWIWEDPKVSRPLMRNGMRSTGFLRRRKKKNEWCECLNWHPGRKRSFFGRNFSAVPIRTWARRAIGSESRCVRCRIVCYPMTGVWWHRAPPSFSTRSTLMPMTCRRNAIRSSIMCFSSWSRRSTPPGWICRTFSTWRSRIVSTRTAWRIIICSIFGRECWGRRPIWRRFGSGRRMIGRPFSWQIAAGVPGGWSIFRSWESTIPWMCTGGVGIYPVHGKPKKSVMILCRRINFIWLLKTGETDAYEGWTQTIRTPFLHQTVRTFEILTSQETLQPNSAWSSLPMCVVLILSKKEN